MCWLAIKCGCFGVSRGRWEELEPFSFLCPVLILMLKLIYESYYDMAFNVLVSVDWTGHKILQPVLCDISDVIIQYQKTERVMKFRYIYGFQILILIGWCCIGLTSKETNSNPKFKWKRLILNLSLLELTKSTLAGQIWNIFHDQDIS